MSRNYQRGLNCQKKKRGGGLVLWKSCVVPSLAYCTHDTVQIAGNGVGENPQEKKRDSEALSTLPRSGSACTTCFLHQGLKSEVRVLDRSLIPGCVVQTSEVSWEVFWAVYMCSEKRLM